MSNGITLRQKCLEGPTIDKTVYGQYGPLLLYVVLVVIIVAGIEVKTKKFLLSGLFFGI